MGFYGDLMGFYSDDLMGFYSDLMGLIYPQVN